MKGKRDMKYTVRQQCHTSKSNSCNRISMVSAVIQHDMKKNRKSLQCSNFTKDHATAGGIQFT